MTSLAIVLFRTCNMASGVCQEQVSKVISPTYTRPLKTYIRCTGDLLQGAGNQLDLFPQAEASGDIRSMSGCKN